jgi:hypothetical protein
MGIVFSFIHITFRFLDTGVSRESFYVGSFVFRKRLIDNIFQMQRGAVGRTFTIWPAAYFFFNLTFGTLRD